MKSFYVGLKAVITLEDSVLILKRSARESHSRSCWDFPGGRMNEGEEIKVALQRELREEIGYEGEIQLFKLLEVYKVSFDVEHHHGLLLIFYKVDVPISTVILSDEHESFEWVKRDDLDDFLAKESASMHSGVRNALLQAFAHK